MPRKRDVKIVYASYDVPQTSFGQIHNEGWMRDYPPGTWTTWYNGCGILGPWTRERTFEEARQLAGEYVAGRLVERRDKLIRDLAETMAVLDHVEPTGEWLERYREPLDVVIAGERDSDVQYERWHGSKRPGSRTARLEAEMAGGTR